MKICETCGASFKRLVQIDNKLKDLGSRKNCLACVPYGKRVYKNKQGTICVCVLCKKRYAYRKGSGSLQKCKECYSRLARHALKLKAVTYKGGACIFCNYSKCVEALEFHHTDPKKKKFQISGNLTRKWETIKKELDKCILVCANCHRERHF